MNTNTTNQFAADLAVAREYVASVNFTGERPAMVREFLNANTDEERQAVVEAHGGGHIRRGLRQIAKRMEGKANLNQDLADVFWALRDDIDPEDDTVFVIEVDAA